MDEFVGGRALIYKSATIYERRRRVLSMTRRMIAEKGLSGFNVRELCQRSGIAMKTLYNAFGSKENVIAMAIRQYQADFHEHVTYRYDPLTLEGRLERVVKVHSRNLQIRPYTTAIMAVYNSPSADPVIRAAIREISYGSLRPWSAALASRRQFAVGVDAQLYMDLETTAQYATLTDWCCGDIADDKMLDRMTGSFLGVLSSATRGESYRLARNWLQSVRTHDEAWETFKRAAIFKDGDLRRPPPTAAAT